jgi:hypothetical protein
MLVIKTYTSKDTYSKKFFSILEKTHYYISSYSTQNTVITLNISNDKNDKKKSYVVSDCI